MLTPQRFVDDLKVLELEGVGSKAAPEGLPSVDDGTGKLRQFQAAYDQKYHYEVAPPPRAASAPINSVRTNPIPASPAGSSTSLKPEVLRKAEGKGKKEKEKDGEKKKRHFFGF